MLGEEFCMDLGKQDVSGCWAWGRTAVRCGCYRLLLGIRQYCGDDWRDQATLLYFQSLSYFEFLGGKTAESRKRMRRWNRK